MFPKLKIWHFLLGMLGFILIVRFTFVIETISMLIFFVYFSFIDFKGMLIHLDWSIFDYLISIIVLFAVPVIVLVYKNKSGLLSQPVSIISCMIIVLISLAVLSPVVSPSDPNFQHDISVAKLLPPLSSKTIVRLDKNLDDLEASKKIINRKRSLKPVLNSETLFVCDSVELAEGVTLHRNGIEKIISKEYLDENKFIVKTNGITFLLGTDAFGRDVFSRIIYGTRLSLTIGFCSVVISFIVGIILGFLSGYLGGIVDTLLNRLTEMFMAFPMIFLIILIVALFGSSLLVIIMILGLSGWMGLFKIVRGEVLSLKSKDFVITAKLLGRSNYFILFKEMLPLMLSPVIVHLVLQYSNVIIAESALSFLGLGLDSHFASWGGMIQAGQNYLSQAWWISIFPCLFLFITLILLNNLGKKLEAFFDPRLEQ